MGSSGAKYAGERMELYGGSAEEAAIRARELAGQLGTSLGATDSDLSRVLVPLMEQQARLGQSQGLLSGLSNQLMGGAFGQTAGLGMAAVNAARLSGGGRYGGGGMAATIAARGAAQGAATQSGALSQALVQGRVADAQHQSNILAQQGGVANAIASLLQTQAGLREERGRLGISTEQFLANLQLGRMGVMGGVSTAAQSASAQEQSALISGLFNLGGAYLSNRK